MDHFDVPAMGRTAALPPTLIIHDQDDTSTPASDGAAIAAAWTGSRLRLTSGLGHRRLLSSPDVRRRRDRLRHDLEAVAIPFGVEPLPSGMCSAE